MSTAIANETVRRDFFTCLGIWLSLETLGFVVLPLVGLVPSNSELTPWFIVSLALGVSGAFLLSFGARLLLKSRTTGGRFGRVFKVLLGQLAGWLGLVGIAFPLLIMSIGIFTNVFSVLTR